MMSINSTEIAEDFIHNDNTNENLSNSELIDRFSELEMKIALNLSRSEIKIVGVIKEIHKNQLVLQVQNYLINLETKFSTRNFKINNQIYALVIVTDFPSKSTKPKLLGNLSFRALFLAKFSEQKHMYPLYKSYIRTVSIVSAWCKKYDMEVSNHSLSNHSSRSLIKNIGLINIGNSNLKEHFVKLFKSKCVGSIRIFNIDSNIPRSKVGISFINSLNFFIKYYDIDMIFVLADELIQREIYELSTIYVMKSFLKIRQKSMPIYLIYNGFKNLPIGLLFDDIIDIIGTQDIIDKIYHIQKEYSDNLSKSICKSEDNIKLILHEFNERLILFENEFFSSKKELFFARKKVLKKNTLMMLSNILKNKLADLANQIDQIELSINKDLIKMGSDFCVYS